MAIGDIKLSANFQVNVAKPIDSKFHVADISERNALTFLYPGLKTYVISEDKFYYWDGTQWVEFTGGSGGGTGGIITYVNGSIVSARKDLFYSGTISDSTGYFEINSDINDHISNVIFYEGQEFVVNNSEPIENRIATTVIEDISPTGVISGYAFIRRNSTALVGNINKSVIPVPQGTSVTVKITGE